MNPIRVIILGCFPVAVCSINAAIVEWTDWESATIGQAGSASGSIGSIGLSYSGDVTWAQTGSGTDYVPYDAGIDANYWAEKNPAPYTGSSAIDNAPTPAELIGLSNPGIVNSIVFSIPVFKPIMAILSLGRAGVQVGYDFDSSFNLLSEGRGHWGMDADGVSLLPGNLLVGEEFHGAIQFNGWVRSISWEVSQYEFSSSITVGLLDQPDSRVPDGNAATGLLLAITTLGLIRLKHMRTVAARDSEESPAA